MFMRQDTIAFARCLQRVIMMLERLKAVHRTFTEILTYTFQSILIYYRKKKVPDVLFTTIDPPSEIQTYGRGSLIQARLVETSEQYSYLFGFNFY